mgnify:CR=1 FL=1
MQEGRKCKSGLVLGGRALALTAPSPLSCQAIPINDACRVAGARFIMTDTFGLFGSVFCDFGDEFVVVDTNGEEPMSAMIASITQDEAGLVTCLDEGRHGLEDGDYVTFTEVRGMDQLNDSDARPVKVVGPYTFTIEDTRGYGAYVSGGNVVQVKQKKTISFKSLRDALQQPDFLMSDFAKFDRPMQLHLGFQALDRYRSDHGVLPPPSDAAAAAEVLHTAQGLAKATGDEVDFSEQVMRNLASGARGELSPMCAFLGGIAAQEVMKAASGKFSPVQQWLYFDAEEVTAPMPPPADPPPYASRPRRVAHRPHAPADSPPTRPLLPPARLATWLASSR